MYDVQKEILNGQYSLNLPHKPSISTFVGTPKDAVEFGSHYKAVVHQGNGVDIYTGKT